MSLPTRRRRARNRPHDLEAWLEYATVAFETGSSEESAEAALHAAGLASFQDEYWRTGHLLAATGQREAAEKLFRRAIFEAPHEPKAHGLLGRLLVDAGQMKEGMETIAAAIRLGPERAEGHLHLGHALTTLERHEEAVESLRTARRLAPDDDEVALALGVALARVGEDEAAVECLGGILERDPRQIAARLERGAARARLGDPTAAIEDLREVIRLEPDLAQAHWSLGMVLLEVGRLESAEAMFEAARALAPDEGFSGVEIDPGADEREAELVLERLEISERAPAPTTMPMIPPGATPVLYGRLEECPLEQIVERLADSPRAHLARLVGPWGGRRRGAAGRLAAARPG